MGQNQQNIFSQGEPLSNFQVVQKVPQHNISYLKHKITTKEYLIRQFAINDKTQFAQTLQRIKNRKKLDSLYLTKLQRYAEQMQDNICSSFYKIFAMWVYPTHTLTDQISERTLNKRRFQENEIFSIAASIIQGMSCLQSSGIKHECLTTSSILFDQTGTVIVADPLTSIYPTNFDRINTNRKTKNVYISPQQCQSLKNQRPIPNRNPYKSDVFILGLILLECGLLQKIDTVFVEDFEEIDLQEVQNKLNEFSRHYSQDLRLTVQTMLTRDPKQRMDWVGLRQYIPQKSNADTNKPSLSAGQRSQTKSTGFQLFNKLTLGGGKPQSSLNSYSKEPVYNFAKYQENYGYGKPSSQPSQIIGQPIQSISYQPISTYTGGNLPVFSSNNYPVPSASSYTPLTNTQFGNQKVSEYVFQGKIHSQRPTGQLLSKITPAVGVNSVDRESSSFPLTSNLQFKKDYLNNYLNNNQNFNNTYGLNYQPIKNYSLTKQVYPSTSPNYNIQPTSTYVPQIYSQGVNKYESNINKSVFNNDLKTEINSQFQGSPFIPYGVKDAKSITYDKNIYSSSQLKTQEYGQMPQPTFSTIMVSNQKEQEYSPNNIYQPLAKGKGPQDTSIYKISSNPVLYQPLVGPTSEIKQNPNLSPQISAIKPNQPKSNSIAYQTSIKQSPYNPSNQLNPSISASPNQPVYTSHKQELNYSENQQLQFVIEHFKQGSRYEGTKYQDMRHGQGKFFYQDGGMYEGNWRLNKMDGYGKLYYQSGKIAYEGNWSQDQFQGFGKLYNEEPDQLYEMFDYENFDLLDEYWVYYEGNFYADEKNGEGKTMLSNGEYFVGSFHHDMVQGPGEFHRKNGQIIKGIWNQNQMVEHQQ